MPCVFKVLGRLQQRLRRNATNVGASASRRWAPRRVFPIVDARGCETKLGRANRGNVAAWSAANHDDVEGFRRHLDLEQQARRVFERFLHRDQCEDRFAAVDDPVVIRKRQVVHRPDHDLAVFDNRTILGRMNS
jgi:hypothetical protein